MTGAQKRAVVVISWRATVALLIGVAGWDAAGLLIGDSVYRSHSYDVLRGLPPGGMRGWGVALAALFIVLAASLWWHTYTGRTGPVRWALTGLTVWWAAWTAGLLSAWLIHRTIYAWSLPPKVATCAVLAYLAARAVHQRRPREVMTAPGRG